MQDLIYGGKELKDGKTLKDYKIGKGATLEAVLVLKGDLKYVKSHGPTNNFNNSLFFVKPLIYFFIIISDLFIILMQLITVSFHNWVNFLKLYFHEWLSLF